MIKVTEKYISSKIILKKLGVSFVRNFQHDSNGAHW